MTITILWLKKKDVIGILFKDNPFVIRVKIKKKIPIRVSSTNTKDVFALL